MVIIISILYCIVYSTKKREEAALRWFHWLIEKQCDYDRCVHVSVCVCVGV